MLFFCRQVGEQQNHLTYFTRILYLKRLYCCIIYKQLKYSLKFYYCSYFQQLCTFALLQSCLSECIISCPSLALGSNSIIHACFCLLHQLQVVQCTVDSPSAATSVHAFSLDLTMGGDSPYSGLSAVQTPMSVLCSALTPLPSFKSLSF